MPLEIKMQPSLHSAYYVVHNKDKIIFRTFKGTQVHSWCCIFVDDEEVAKTHGDMKQRLQKLKLNVYPSLSLVCTILKSKMLYRMYLIGCICPNDANVFIGGPIGANLKSQSTSLNGFRNSQSKQQMIYVASAKDWMIKTGNTKL